jgi:hypothetical protein
MTWKDNVGVVEELKVEMVECRPSEAITTYTPIMWAALTDDQRYEEYIRVRTALAEALKR